MPEDEDTPIQKAAPLVHDFGEITFADMSGEIERPHHVPSVFSQPEPEPTKNTNHLHAAIIIICIAVAILVSATIYFVKHQELKSLQTQAASTQAEINVVNNTIQKLSAQVGEKAAAAQAIVKRDNQRIQAIAAIEIELLAYRANNKGSYPDATVLNRAWILASQSLDEKIVTAPEGSFIAVPSNWTGSSSDTSVPESWLIKPSIKQYVYEPRTASGAVCLASDKCTSYKLWYQLEASEGLKVKSSTPLSN